MVKYKITRNDGEEWFGESQKELLENIGLSHMTRNLRNTYGDEDKFVKNKLDGYMYRIDIMEENNSFPFGDNLDEEVQLCGCDSCGKEGKLYVFRNHELCWDCYNDNEIISSLLNDIKEPKKKRFIPLFNESGIYKALLYGDLHLPYSNNEALNIMYQILKEEDIVEIVDMGDSIDASMLSEKFPNYEKEKYSLASEIKLFEEHLRNMKSIKPNAKMTLIECNHYSTRLKKYLANNPALEGMIKDIDFQFDEKVLYSKPYFPLKEYGQDQLGAIHGYSSTDFYTKKLTLEFPTDMIQGHCHTSQFYYNKNKKKAYGIGCMSKLDMAYLFNQPTRWQNQFAILIYDANNNIYKIEFIDINDGVALYRDKIYKG